MKILHIVQNYYPSKGGTQTLFKEVSERLVKNYGDEVTVCTTNSFYGPEKKTLKPIPLHTETINGVTIKRFSFFRFHLKLIRFLKKVVKFLSLSMPEGLIRYTVGPWSPKMKKFILEFDGDVICASSSNYLYMTYPLEKQARQPFVFMGAAHFSENETYNPIFSKVMEAIRLSEAYIANTVFEKNRLAFFGIDESKIKVAGCGVDVNAMINTVPPNTFRKKYGIGQGLIVGYVGRHVPSKGLGLLLEAMQLLWKKDENYQLIIAGSPTDYTAELKQKVQQSGAFATNVIFITDFSDDEKIGIFNNLDVFVSVSTEESFGIVYLEAWACKKPVIGANIGAVRSVIDHGINGFLVEPGNHAELAIRIDELCNYEGKRQEMGLAGYHKVQAEYSWDIITEKYRQIYLDAITRNACEKNYLGVKEEEGIEIIF